MPPLVLIADDDPVISRLVELRLSLAGYAVLVATDGLDVLRKLRTAKPVLMLLDLQMPGLGGLDLLKIVRGEDYWSGARVVMLTASAEDCDIAAAHRIGADGYLLKPFDADVLVERVNRLLGARDTLWMDDQHCVVRAVRA